MWPAKGFTAWYIWWVFLFANLFNDGGLTTTQIDSEPNNPEMNSLRRNDPGTNNPGTNNPGINYPELNNPEMNYLGMNPPLTRTVTCI